MVESGPEGDNHGVLAQGSMACPYASFEEMNNG
jgi:hypothetical protein